VSITSNGDDDDRPALFLACATSIAGHSFLHAFRWVIDIMIHLLTVVSEVEGRVVGTIGRMGMMKADTAGSKRSKLTTFPIILVIGLCFLCTKRGQFSKSFVMKSSF